MPAPASYEFVVIGGGPAGITAATTAADCGRRVALVDSHRELGGAGINTGTVPSKTLRETALALSGLRSRDLYGIDLSLRREVNVSDFLHHEQAVRNTFNRLLSQRLEIHKTDVFKGNATFIDPHTLRISADGQEDVQLHGDKILIATGSSPIRPPLFFSGPGEVYDSDTILELDRIPKTMGVVGAGVIGSEYGCTFAALGAKVHLIDGRDTLLSFLDPDLSQALTVAMEKNGVIFHWKQKVTACNRLDSGAVTLTLSPGDALTVDAVLVAAGRQSNTGTLALAAAGLTADEKGTLPVDENYATKVPHIYAAGDVIGYPALASTSMAQARIATRHALGQEASGLPPLLPTGIYTIPEISTVGESETSLKKKNIAYVAGLARYENNARGRIIGDTEGFLKLLFRREDMKLIGVQALGEQATELVHVGLLGIAYGSDAEFFIETCFNLPTLGMLYKTAARHAVAARTG